MFRIRAASDRVTVGQPETFGPCGNLPGGAESIPHAHRCRPDVEPRGSDLGLPQVSEYSGEHGLVVAFVTPTSEVCYIPHPPDVTGPAIETIRQCSIESD